MDILVVTAAVINKEDKVLIAQRRDTGREQHKWEFPGGKLEEDEDPKDGLKREIMEELDTVIKVGDIFEVVYERFETFNLLLLCYKTKYVSGKTKALECKNFKWVTIDELKNYEFSNADIVIKDKLMEEGLSK